MSSDIDDAEVVAGLTRGELLRRGAGLAAVASFPGIFATDGALAADAGDIGGTLRYFGFQGRDLQPAMADWQRRNGVTMISAYQVSPTDTIARFRANRGEGVDILNTSVADNPDYLRVGNILRVLDRKKLPGLKNLSPIFRKKRPGLWSDFRGQLVAVPLLFNAFGIAYDSSKMRRPTSWLDLMDRQHTGKIAVLDNPVQVFTIGAYALDMNAQKLTQANVDRLTERWARPLVRQARTVSRSQGDAITLLSSGEAVAMFGASPTVALQAIAAGNKNVRFTARIKEGTVTVVMGYGIPPRAENVDTAYAWINALLAPRLNAAAANSVQFGTTVKGAYKFLTPSSRARYPYKQLDDFLRKTPISIPPPLRSTGNYLGIDKLQEIWTRLKAGE